MNTKATKLAPDIVRSREVSTKAGHSIEVVVHLKPGQHLLVVEADKMYQFNGDPLDDVLSGDALLGLGRVTWDNLEQEWLSVD